MAHDHGEVDCECCLRTAKAWTAINDIAEALDLRRSWSCHPDVTDIIKQIEDLQDLIKRQKYVLGQLSRGKR